MAATGKVLGTVTSVVGEAKATAADGTVRILQVGDVVHSDEVITTNAAGSINIALASGKTLDCGANTDLSLHESILGVATAAVAAPATAGAPAAPGSVEAIQQAIAAGQDPSQIAPATAAGGAPGAGGAGDGGGGTPVILEQANTSSIVTSGFSTEGATITFPTPEFELLPEEEQPPTVSVSVQVQVQVEVEVDVSIEAGPEVLSGPATGGVFAVSASGDAVSLIEGTMEGTMEIPFVITLSQVFDTDVQVTYQIVPASADNPTDFFDGDLIQTITIPAGESSFIVPIQIVRDHFVEGNESFSIVLIDAVNATINPAQSSAMVTIFNDDANPVANADTNWVQEESPLVASGNVLQSASHSGAPSGSFADAADTDFEPLTVTNPGTYTGSFGTLVLAANGSYTYTLNNGNAAVQALDSGETLTESFGYSATDGFNTPDSATLTITIFGSNDTPIIQVRTSSEIFATGAEASVNEAALALGSNPSSNGEFATGSFQVSDTDGVEDIASVTINGQTVAIGSLVGATFAGSAGTMTVTSYSGGIANFTYELTQAVSDGAGAETDVFTLTASDGTSTSAPATVTISIVDDVPTAANDSNSMTEDSASVSGNVRDNDTQGADRIATVGAGTLQGEFGTLALNSDGGYTYTRTANLQGMDDGESVVDTFPYVLTDADGDASPAQLTITLNGANDAPVAIDDTNSMTEEQVSVSGNVLANDTDVDVETLTVVGDPITLGNAMGTLVIQDDGSYTFTLSEAGVAAAQALDDGENFVVSFGDAYQNTDGDANSNLADVTITVTGLNDAPVAIDDTNSMTEDQASVSGNVIANDTDIDDEPLTVVGTPITLEDEMGTLVIDQANGSYTFTLSQAGAAAAQALDDGENFVVTFSDAYQNTDGDANSNLADVAITVTGLNDGPSITVTQGAEGTVFEPALSNGSNPTSDGEFHSGTFTVADADGLDDIQSVTINGQTVAIGSLVGATFNGTAGVMTVTAYNAGVASFTYELSGAVTDVADQAETDVFTLTVSDGTTTSGQANVTITIVDDLPVSAAPSGTIENDDGESLVGLVQYDMNADGLGTVTLTTPTVTSGGNPFVLTSHDSTLVYEVIDTDGDGMEELYARADTDNDGQSDDLVFVLAPTTQEDPDGAYTLTMYDVVDLPVPTVELSFSHLESDPQITDRVAVLNAAETESNLLISAVNAGDRVADSASFVGIHNNIMNELETIRYEFGTVDIDPGTKQNPNPDYLTVTDRSLVNDVQLLAFDTSAQGIDSFTWQAFKDGALVGSGGPGDVESDIPQGNVGALFPPIHVDGGYDTLIFTVTDDSEFKVGGVTYQELGDAQDVNLAIAFGGADADGDPISGSFNVTITNGDGTAESTIIEQLLNQTA